jgi:hypothetical protein
MKKIIILLVLVCIKVSIFSKEVVTFRPLFSNNIEVKASSEHPGFEARGVTSQDSFERNCLLKNNTGKNMWISQISEGEVQANNHVKKGAAWILFNFDKPYPIEIIQIWNHNQNDHTKRGLRKVYIEYTADGVKWEILKNGNLDYYILPESGGKFAQPADFDINLGGKKIKSICITADKEEGNYYHSGNKQVVEDALLRSQNINYYALGKIRFYTKSKVEQSGLPKIERINIKASQGYLKTSKGPSREFMIDFDQSVYTGGKVKLSYRDQIQEYNISNNPLGTYSQTLLFNPGYMENDERVRIEFKSVQGDIDTTVLVPGARKWELHFLAHSHQDIGYTHRQHEVMTRQWTNLERAVELAEKTKDYPDGSQFKWNTEATWSLAGYLKEYEGTEKAEHLKSAIKKGQIGVDATLGSILTGICKQEELMHLFDDAQALEKELGMTFNTAMFSDLPGAVWGMTSAFAQNGIKYFSSAPNYTPTYPAGGSRVGYMHRFWGDKPFYWVSPSGNDKVLHWATGTGYSLFHSWIYDRLSDDNLYPIWGVLEDLQDNSYPYPVTYMRYTIHGDNGPPDVNMPDIIRKWNGMYEYPKFFISTTKEVFEDLENRFGGVLPTYSGDLSPFWDDGAASTARELATNRQASERLNQAEILWSMLNKGDFPKKEFEEGWKYVILFSEHTWGAVNSYKDPYSDFTQDQWNEKKSYALRADSIGKLLIQKTFDAREEGDYINVINTNSWHRTDIVEFASVIDLNSCNLLDEKGQVVSLQRLANGNWVFVAKDVPPLASSVYKIIKTETKSQKTNGVIVSKNHLDNGLVYLKIDEKTGNIIELRFNQGKNLAGEKGLNEFVHTNRNASNPKGVETVMCSVIENGPVRATIRIESGAPGCKKLYRDISLVRGIDKVFIRNTVDRTDDLTFQNIRFAFPFSITNAEINVDLAWASMFPERQQLRGANRNFFSVQNGLSLSNAYEGIMLTTPDAPFAELGDMSGEKWMTDTGARTDWRLTAQVSPTIYSWVMNNSWTTNYKASQSGETVFNYEISEFSPLKLSDAKKKGGEAAQKLIVRQSISPINIEPMFEIGSLDIVVSTIKPMKDGYFVRLFNQSDATVNSTIKWRRFMPGKIYQCNNKGEIIKQLSSLDMFMKPYEVKNILIVN